MSSSSTKHAAESVAEHGSVFSFAHLSDPHLSSLAGVKLRKLANKRMLGYLSWRHRRRNEHRREVLDALVRDMQGFKPDHVLVTGDLTHIGLPSEFVEVRHWLDGVGPADKVMVVPGNHDRYVREKWRETFDHWMPYMAADEAPDQVPRQLPSAVRTDADGEPLQSLFPALRLRDEVALIGLSSSRPSAPLLAVGSLGDEQLQWLASMLKQTGKRGLFRIVMLHHPPQAGAEPWRKRLTDAAALREVIAEQGAELILHGHTHSSSRAHFATPAGQALVLGVPSASAISDASGEHARYHLHRLRREPGGWRLKTVVRGCARTGHGFAEERQFEDFIAAAS